MSTEFWIPAGSPLPARVLGGSLDGDHAELTIELAPDDWETADMVMLFHLQWNDRNEGEIEGGGDVRIEMRLAPALVGDLRALVGDAGDVAAAIVSLDREHPLRSTQSWYAMRVTESIDLPPALAAKGEVRSGFTTRWDDEPPPT